MVEIVRIFMTELPTFGCENGGTGKLARGGLTPTGLVWARKREREQRAIVGEGGGWLDIAEQTKPLARHANLGYNQNICKSSSSPKKERRKEGTRGEM